MFAVQSNSSQHAARVWLSEGAWGKLREFQEVIPKTKSDSWWCIKGPWCSSGISRIPSRPLKKAANSALCNIKHSNAPEASLQKQTEHTDMPPSADGSTKYYMASLEFNFLMVQQRSLCWALGLILWVGNEGEKSKQSLNSFKAEEMTLWDLFIDD